jgi:hypothetical protein
VLTWVSARSESRSGYDKSVKKNGAGGWGSLEDDIANGQVRVGCLMRRGCGWVTPGLGGI